MLSYATVLWKAGEIAKYVGLRVIGFLKLYIMFAKVIIGFSQIPAATDPASTVPKRGPCNAGARYLGQKEEKLAH